MTTAGTAGLTMSGAVAGAVTPAPVVSTPVVLTTDPSVDDVIVTTIVQPPGGIAAPDAIVISVGLTATPGQVPVLPLVVVTPAGIGSEKIAVSSTGAAFAFPSVSVNVDDPPAAIEAGSMILVSADPVAITVNGALDAGVTPAAVTTVLVVLVTVPGVLDVMVTTIVQPPGGIAAPEGSVISVGVTATPVQVPALPLVVVMPAGIGSVNGAVSTCAAALPLASVSVSVAVPPDVMLAGPIVLVSVRPAALTVRGALADGVVPPAVTSVLVVLVTVPEVVDVIVVMIVQPPGGISDPVGSVMSAGVTATPTQVPVLPLVVVTPAGMGSVNGAVSATATALRLPSVSVSVDVPPAAIAAGTIVFVSVDAPAFTVSVALAGGVVPPAVTSVLVVLVTVPGVVDVMLTTIVQPPGGMIEPSAIVINAGVTATPPQLPVLPLFVVTPAGMGSVKAAVNA